MVILVFAKWQKSLGGARTTPRKRKAIIIGAVCLRRLIDFCTQNKNPRAHLSRRCNADHRLGGAMPKALP
ncbi:hypothetical protein J6N69_05635 [bacterium]|nr:hypothetical protein [bacterium]